MPVLDRPGNERAHEMTLSFGELVDQPGGTLVYTTGDGSLTFDERIAGRHFQQIWSYSEELLDHQLIVHRRERLQRHFPGWHAKKLSDAYFVGGFYSTTPIQPTVPVGLLLNKIYVSVEGHGLIEEGATHSDSVFVEMFIAGRVEFIRLGVHNFFRKMKIIEAFGKYDHEKRNKTEAERLMIDIADFELFRSARLVLV